MEHIVALFGSDGAAAAAERDLEKAGIPASAIRRYAASNRVGTSETVAPVSTETTHSSGGGFWSWLFGDETSNDATRSAYSQDADLYERRVQGGNTALSVTVHDDSQIHQVATILDAHNPIEVDEQTDESGLAETERTSLSPSGMDYSTAEIATPPVSVPSGGASEGQAYPVAQGDVPAAGVAASSGRDEVIPLAEEQLEVGKRSVERGATRVRRYVVEKPVEQDVTLHGERVTIERRRPVEGTAVAGGAFEERTVEVHESEEVPVVAKTARVVEEVAVRREATERTETVHDALRREEVEVTGKDAPPSSPSQ